MIIDMIYDHFMILKFIFVLKGSQQCELPCRPLQIDQSHGIYRIAPKKTKTKKKDGSILHHHVLRGLYSPAEQLFPDEWECWWIAFQSIIDLPETKYCPAFELSMDRKNTYHDFMVFQFIPKMFNRSSLGHIM